MIDIFSVGEETEISSLIIKIFDEFIGSEYSELGQQNFRSFASPKSILERNMNGNILLTYKINKQIVGIIEVRENKHICLFFVDPTHHNKGIGRQLMQKLLQMLVGKTESLSVYSSKFAEPIYQKLGFKSLGKLKEKDGIKYIPMSRFV
jgi:predicted GNAT family N-acyltransferase